MHQNEILNDRNALRQLPLRELLRLVDEDPNPPEIAVVLAEHHRLNARWTRP